MKGWETSVAKIIWKSFKRSEVHRPWSAINRCELPSKLNPSSTMFRNFAFCLYIRAFFYRLYCYFQNIFTPLSIANAGSFKTGKFLRIIFNRRGNRMKYSISNENLRWITTNKVVIVTHFCLFLAQVITFNCSFISNKLFAGLSSPKDVITPLLLKVIFLLDGKSLWIDQSSRASTIINKQTSNHGGPRQCCQTYSIWKNRVR